jgi:hypothetical protein
MNSTTTTTRNRPRRRVWRPLAVAMLAACVMPAAASAATVGIERDGTLRYEGSSGGSAVTIRELADAFEVTDSFRLDPVPSGFATCTRLGTRAARCPKGRGIVIRRVAVDLNSGDDTAGPINTHLPVQITGGPGKDTYAPGNPSFLTNVTFLGGPGVFDTVTYAGSGGVVGGRGVRISNDGLANDGRIGLDTDNIGRDVERLFGSSLADEITANGALPFRETREFANMEVRALGGDDVVRVGSTGTTVFIKNGEVADGADKIIAGSTPSIVDYGERSRPVNATLNSGGADDGEAGERDEIIGDHGGLVGGRAGDTLRAPARSTAAHFIDGGAGGDLIEGSEGPDGLTGGAGGDTLVGFGGADALRARDGVTDTVDCGVGADTFDVDTIDNFGNCESGTVGVLRLAPRTLRAEAGETTRLRLAWRHPRAWRELRRIELRVYQGETRVGAVAIRPRGGRIDAVGAVRLADDASRLTRRGKTVTARLALRLGRSLVGRRLRLEVQAVDTGGARQVEARAGFVRVAG